MIDQVKPGGEIGAQGGQGVGLHMVAPGGGAQGEQALLHRIEPAGLHLERRRGIAQRAFSFVELDQGAVQRAGGPVHRRAGRRRAAGLAGRVTASAQRAAHPLQPAQGCGEARAQALTTGQRFGGGLELAQGGFGLLQEFALIAQGCIFARARVQRVQRLQAGAQEGFFLGGPCPVAGEALQTRARGAQRVPGSGGFGAGVRGAGIGVQQGAMGLGVQQAAPVMLAVNLHQQIAEAREQADAGGLVIDVGARAAVGTQRPAQYHRFARPGADAGLIQHCPDRVII